MSSKFYSIALASLSLILMTSQTACLKTRAQLRQEDQSDSATDSAPQPHPRNAYALDELKSEIVRLNGKVEELEHQQKEGSKEVIATLESRVAELEKNQVLVLTELKEIKDKNFEEKNAKTEIEEAKAKPHDSLAKAFKLVDQRKYDAAAEKFRALLQSGLKGKEASEAHFGLGQSLYGAKDYKKSIVSFSKVQELHSKSLRIPLSLYYIARAFEHLNMKKEARGFYSELAERFSKSPEAKKAREKLKE